MKFTADHCVVNRVITVLVMGGMQAGRISTFLPGYSKAILSARRIFKLLDTVPQIDSYSNEGLEPVSEYNVVVCIISLLSLQLFILLDSLSMVVLNSRDLPGRLWLSKTHPKTAL